MADSDDPFLQVQADVQGTLTTTRHLFSSYLRIRTLAPSGVSPELTQSRNELQANLETLTADLSDMIDSVHAVEKDPGRFGLNTAELSRRRAFVRDVGGEVESMRHELGNGDAATAAVAPGGGARATGQAQQSIRNEPAGAAVAAGEDDEDAYGAFESQQQTQMMHEQDEQMDDVFQTVGRLRGHAVEMGRELEEQGTMLDEVDTLVDRVGGKLQVGMKRVGQVIRRNEDTVSSCCIAVLIFVLIILLILVIVL